MEDTRDLSWVFKAGEEVYGERYWLIFMGAVGDGDFWLFNGMLWGDIYGLHSELIF